MSALLLALALMTDPAPGAPVDPTTAPPAATAPPSATAQAPAAPVEAAPAPEPTPATVPAPVAEDETPYPPDAPKDDYGLVAWCYGVLGGYLDLHDRVIPEVTRIEGAFRQPGSSLSQDMAVYEDMRKVSRSNMKLFARAMEAAERASLRPINTVGAAAVAKGRSSWSAAANLPTRVVAQQWMGWTLPAVCPTRAEQLEARSKLMGVTFKANEAPSGSSPGAGSRVPRSWPFSMHGSKARPQAQPRFQAPAG